MRDPLIGKTLGRHQIVDRLGRGGIARAARQSGLTQTMVTGTT